MNERMEQILASLGAQPSETPEERERRAVESSNRMPGELDDGYDCPLCLNRGFIFTGSNAVRYCTCQPIREGLRRLKQLGLTHAARRMTLDAFVADAPWQRTLLERVRDYVAMEQPGWLFIGGQSGCGKTHLCTAAAVTLMQRGLSLHYMCWMNESASLKALAMDGARSKRLRELIAAPLLYIDDLFKSMPTEADKHIAFELLNGRYNDPTKITIISSERQLPQITQIDEAIGGRIFERCGERYQLNVRSDPARNYRFRPTQEI